MLGVRLVGVSREEGTKRCSLAGAAAGGCGLCWERGLEEQEQLCPQEPGIAAAATAGMGWNRRRCELGKLCGSLLLSWLSLGELHIQS